MTGAARAVAAPLVLRGVELRNRVVGAPMERNYCDLAGRATQQYADYLGARAAGGAALLFTESSYVSSESKARPHQAGMHDDAVLPGLRRLADAVHAHGALLGVELNHAGRVVPSVVSQQRPVGPSAVACTEIGGEVPRALSEADIGRVVAAFGHAASRAVRGGADVLSVHGAHGYLVAQFLSPRSNRRTDRWGSPTAFLNAVLRAVRNGAGETVPVFLRLSAFEGLPGGLDVEDSLALVDDMDLDLVDVVDLSAGTYGAGQWITPSGEVDEGYLAETARRYRDRTGLPVALAGRVVSPDAAERLVSSGAVDLVCAARALHADAGWAGHVVRGTDPRPCVSCNQGCADVIFTGAPLWCAANPRTGHEGEEDRRPRWLELVTEPGTAVVVGGGPAGLEAAVTLAEAGLRVTLHERESRIGGQHALAATLLAKPRFDRLLDWYAARLDRLGVQVLTGRAASPVDLRGADVVVLATGGVDHLPSGLRSPRLVGLRRWLHQEGHQPLPPALTVWGADRAGVYLADDAAARGCRVTVVARQDDLAPEAGARERLHAVERLRGSERVQLHLGVVLAEVTESDLVLHEGQEERRVPTTGPVLVSQGSVPTYADPSSWTDGLDGGTVLEHAVETDVATFDAAVGIGRRAARRAVARHAAIGSGGPSLVPAGAR